MRSKQVMKMTVTSLIIGAALGCALGWSVKNNSLEIKEPTVNSTSPKKEISSRKPTSNWLKKIGLGRSPKIITVTVGGEVESPQIIQVSSGTTLLEAINIAGGRRPWGTARHTRYFLGEDMWTYDIETASHLVLHDRSIIVVPSKSYWEEWQPKYYPVYGNNSPSIAELELTLSNEIEGHWIPNFWDGMRGIEFRVPKEKGGYTCFIRPPTDKEISRYQSNAPSGEELVFSVLIRPTNNRIFSKTTSKIRQTIQSLVSDQN